MDTASLGEWIRSERTAALVVNARSRRGERLYRRTAEALRRRGFTLVDAHPVRDPAQLRTAVRKALTRGAHLLVVGGGDGTISSAVNELVGRDVALGLIPLGTQNSAARTLGIPLSVDGAVNVLVDGAVTEIDLGRIGDSYFVNVAAAGIAAETSRITRTRWKQLLGKIAFLLTGLGLYLSYRPFYCRLDTDHEHIEVLAREVVIASGRYYGDTVLSPEASIRDGTLLIHTIDAVPLHTVCWQAFRFLFLRRPGLPGTHHFTAARVRIDTDPPLQLMVDGESTVLTPAEISIAPRALKVMAPRSSDLV